MNIGFVSTRFSGTDGVSLESQKWADALERLGHKCFWFSGLSDRLPKCSMVVPEAFFEHPTIRMINNAVWNVDAIPTSIVESIEEISKYLEANINDFCRRFEIDLLISQNALTIPMNLPLGLALTNHIESSGIPTVAHHHDFYWERRRFTGNGVLPYLEKAFPPSLDSITHVVINSEAGRQLDDRLKLSSILVPNVMDFETTPEISFASSVIKSELGFANEDILFLQPTRVVPRKGIEHSIELVARLEDPHIKLVISHESGDEGHDYRDSLIALAKARQVDLRLIGDPVESSRKPPFTLEELYRVADFITYPSLYEGFGNALLETVFFRKLALVNRYPVFIDDIEHLGLNFVTMDGEVTNETVKQVRQLLADPARISAAVDHNFEVAKRHFAFNRITDPLSLLLSSV